MTHTRVTDTHTIEEIVRETWKGDDSFFEKYAVNDGEEASIADTTAKVAGFIEQYGAEFYALCDDAGNYIGYVNVLPSMNMLQSFGVKRPLRDAKNKKDFMLILDSLFPNGQIVVSLYKKNTRAINFFINNGYEELNEEVVTLVKNKK